MPIDEPMTGANADSARLAGALAGDEDAVADLVDRWTPVIQARVARVLLGRGSVRVRVQVEDLVQDVFLTLFEDDGRVLGTWEPGKGLSLDNFVGLVATRRAVSYLRSGKRTAWREDPTLDDADAGGPVSVAGEPGPEERAASRDTLQRLLDRLRDDLSPQGWQLFDLLYVRQLEVPEVRDATGLTADAVYAWRSRLRRHARQVLASLSESGAPRRISRKEGKP